MDSVEKARELLRETLREDIEEWENLSDKEILILAITFGGLAFRTFFGIWEQLERISTSLDRVSLHLKTGGEDD